VVHKITGMASVEPQPVLTPLTEAAIFLVATVADGGEETVAEVLADVGGVTRSVGFRIPDGGLTCVVGIGSDVWGRLYPGATRPAGLHPFTELRGDRHTAPSTPGDLLFHIRGSRMDLCFELADRLAQQLGPAIEIVDEVHGFKYFDRRDLLGFVDGTENPTGRAAAEAVTIGDEDPDFAGGSYVIVQKYLHDMTSWHALSTEEQERVIGRTKLGDMELADAVLPANSHVALNTVVDENGDEREILRDNMPFGHVGSAEYGTYFIGYAASPDIIELMLRNMFIGRPAGNTDRVLDFSTAVTGTLFFVPTADFLEDPPEPVPATAEQPEEPVTFSLRVGSLKGSQ
jgi:putative iron-dependent peroxidase